MRRIRSRDDGLPLRQAAQQGFRPGPIELGEDIVEQEDRGTPALGRHELMTGQTQGQNQGTLLTLRGMSPSAHPADFQQ